VHVYKCVNAIWWRHQFQ